MPVRNFQPERPATVQLKEACKVTDARWATWLQMLEGRWVILVQANLNKAKRSSLMEFIQEPGAASWLAGTLTSGRIRSRQTGSFASTLKCYHLYAFPNIQNHCALLVGADVLEKSAEYLFRILAMSAPVLSNPGNRELESIPPTTMNVQPLEFLKAALDIDWASVELDALLQHVAHYALELVNARGVEFGFLDEENGVVNVTVRSIPDGADPSWLGAQRIQIPLMADVSGRVIALGEPLVVNDYISWNGRYYSEREAPFTSAVGIPLKIQEKAIGALTIFDNRSERIFRSEDVHLLEMLAPLVTVWIRNARLYQELQDRIKAQQLAENRLIQSARLAAVGEMAAGVAHELNNPLTTVAGFVELVLEDLPKDSLHRPDLELVLQEAQRARGVVRRLLDFSRPAENQHVRTDLNELVSDVLTLVHHLVRTGGVEMMIELWDDLPWISVDSSQIKQVLLNLIHNAIQAMPTGGTLSVKTTPVNRQARDWLAISIADTGIGISPENLERIFEPFFSTRPAGQGTGLGLSVSYGIITEHGGTIEVESQPGKGSCFTIYLPIDGNETPVESGG